MEKIKNPELVAVELTKAVVQKLDYGKDSGNADLIGRSAKEAFKDIYNFICNLNSEIK